jgi:hypothetical protein
VTDDWQANSQDDDCDEARSGTSKNVLVNHCRFTSQLLRDRSESTAQYTDGARESPPSPNTGGAAAYPAANELARSAVVAFAG